MNKRLISYLLMGLMVFGLVTGVMWRSSIAGGIAKVALIEKEASVNNQLDKYTSNKKAKDLKDDTIEEAEGIEDSKEEEENTQLASMAKITTEQAIASALKAVPGSIMKVELDNENGKLVYSVEVKTNNGISDVKVDAKTGEVLAQNMGQDEEVNVDNDNIQLEQQGKYND